MKKSAVKTAFLRWSGLSPKQFLSNLDIRSQTDGARIRNIRARMHFPHQVEICLEVTKRRKCNEKGPAFDIKYGVYDSQFGKLVIAVLEEKICALAFFDNENSDSALSALYQSFAGSLFTNDQDVTKAAYEAIFVRARARAMGRVALTVQGTPFQIKVWKTLLTTACGQLLTYGDVARIIGHPRAVRAVGSAVGQNPISLIIPCHRVIGTSSIFDTQYRWGPDRKLALIGWEQAAKFP